MSTVFVFKVGPFALKSGPLNVYFAYGSHVDPISGADDVEALRRIAEQDPSATLTCEPKLREAGAELGYVVVPFSRKMAHRCAIATLQLAAAASLEDVDDDDVVDALCDAANAFVFARVTETFVPSTAFFVDVEGPVHHRYEAMLQGEDTDVFGFLLYEEPGTIAKMRSGELPQDEPVPSLGLFLRPEPAFAVEALQRVYGLDYLPRPTSVKREGHTGSTEDEVLVLAATARAFVDLASKRAYAGSFTMEIGEKRMKATVTIAMPESD